MHLFKLIVEILGCLCVIGFVGTVSLLAYAAHFGNELWHDRD